MPGKSLSGLTPKDPVQKQKPLAGDATALRKSLASSSVLIMTGMANMFATDQAALNNQTAILPASGELVGPGIKLPFDGDQIGRALHPDRTEVSRPDTVSDVVVQRELFRHDADTP